MATASTDRTSMATISQEDCTVAATLLLKQLGIIRLTNILRSRGSSPVPLVLLGSLFVAKASVGEKDYLIQYGLGWKMNNLLQTLRECPRLFKVTSTDFSYNVELIGEAECDSSTALGLVVLKIRDHLLANTHCTLEELRGLLVGDEKQMTLGEPLLGLSAILKSLPDVFTIGHDNTVSLSPIATSRVITSFQSQTSRDIMEFPSQTPILKMNRDEGNEASGCSDTVGEQLTKNTKANAKLWICPQYALKTKIHGFKKLRKMRKMTSLSVRLVDIGLSINIDPGNHNQISDSLVASDGKKIIEIAVEGQELGRTVDGVPLQPADNNTLRRRTSSIRTGSPSPSVRKEGERRNHRRSYNLRTDRTATAKSLVPKKKVPKVKTTDRVNVIEQSKCTNAQRVHSDRGPVDQTAVAGNEYVNLSPAIIPQIKTEFAERSENQEYGRYNPALQHTNPMANLPGGGSLSYSSMPNSPVKTEYVRVKVEPNESEEYNVFLPEGMDAQDNSNTTEHQRISHLGCQSLNQTNEVLSFTATPISTMAKNGTVRRTTFEQSTSYNSEDDDDVFLPVPDDVILPAPAYTQQGGMKSAQRATSLMSESSTYVESKEAISSTESSELHNPANSATSSKEKRGNLPSAICGVATPGVLTSSKPPVTVQTSTTGISQDSIILAGVIFMIKEYLSHYGAKTNSSILDMLMEFGTPMTTKCINLQCVIETLEKHPNTFCIAKSSSDPRKTLICLKEQKVHFDTGIDMLVAYLINSKEGKCTSTDLSTLLRILPEEVCNVFGRTPELLQETISAAAGTEFGIEGSHVILYNHCMWKSLMEKYEYKVQCSAEDKSKCVTGADKSHMSPVKRTDREVSPKQQLSSNTPTFKMNMMHQPHGQAPCCLSSESMTNHITVDDVSPPSLPDFPVGAMVERHTLMPYYDASKRGLKHVKEERLDMMADHMSPVGAQMASTSLRPFDKSNEFVSRYVKDEHLDAMTDRMSPMGVLRSRTSLRPSDEPNECVSTYAKEEHLDTMATNMPPIGARMSRTTLGPSDEAHKYDLRNVKEEHLNGTVADHMSSCQTSTKAKRVPSSGLVESTRLPLLPLTLSSKKQSARHNNRPIKRCYSPDDSFQQSSKRRKADRKHDNERKRTGTKTNRCTKLLSVFRASSSDSDKKERGDVPPAGNPAITTRSTSGSHHQTSGVKLQTRTATYDTAFNIMTHELKNMGARTIHQLHDTLSHWPGFNTLCEWKPIRSRTQLKQMITEDSKHDLRLIEPRDFPHFKAECVVVILGSQYRLFWQAIAWVEDYLLSQNGYCLYNSIQGMVNKMPHDMAKLFQRDRFQLRRSILAASERRFDLRKGKLYLNRLRMGDYLPSKDTHRRSNQCSERRRATSVSSTSSASSCRSSSPRSHRSSRRSVSYRATSVSSTQSASSTTSPSSYNSCNTNISYDDVSAVRRPEQILASRLASMKAASCDMTTTSTTVKPVAQIGRDDGSSIPSLLSGTTTPTVATQESRNGGSSIPSLLSLHVSHHSVESAQACSPDVSTAAIPCKPADKASYYWARDRISSLQFPAQDQDVNNRRGLRKRKRLDSSEVSQDESRKTKIPKPDPSLRDTVISVLKEHLEQKAPRTSQQLYSFVRNYLCQKFTRLELRAACGDNARGLSKILKYTEGFYQIQGDTPTTTLTKPRHIDHLWCLTKQRSSFET